MKTFLSRLGIAALVAVCSQTAQAQPPFTGQVNRPIISPYLNLTNNQNNNGISNYFTQVLPQIQQQDAIQRQQNQIGLLQRQQRAATVNANRNTNPLQNPQIRGTGHPTAFNSYSHYYQIQPGRRQ